jgi:hypothetical protein
MDTQRLDLAPNRWMAAGGLAFIHVRVWKGWIAQITAAPIRDVIVGRATFFGLPHRPTGNAWLAAIVLLSVLLFPDMLWALAVGVDGFNHWFPGVIVIAIAVAFILGRLGRRTRLGIFLSESQFDYVDRIYFNRTQEKDLGILAFCDNLVSLKAEAGDGKRSARTYLVFPWWMSIVFALVALLISGSILYVGIRSLGITDPVPYVIVGDIVIWSLILGVAPERCLLFSKELRRAHSCLLAADPQGAEAMVQPILDAKPKHRYANHLLTLARLMRGDLERAEEIVIKHRTPGPCEPSRYHRIMDYKLWESRHEHH